jgi:hypothetical protein
LHTRLSSKELRFHENDKTLLKIGKIYLSTPGIKQTLSNLLSIEFIRFYYIPYSSIFIINITPVKKIAPTAKHVIIFST